jgi:hypothetical protein
MLALKTRIAGHRRYLEKTALALSFRSQLQVSLSLQPRAPRTFLRKGFGTCISTATLILAACLLAVTFSDAESDKSAVQVSSLIVEAQLDAPVRLSHLRAGSILQGKITRDVYSGERQLFPAGSRLRLTVGKLERRRREHNDHWPWVVQVFARRHENYPSFQSAEIFLPDGARIPIHVSLLSAIHVTEVSVHTKSETSSHETSPPLPKGTSRKRKARKEISGSGPTWILEADCPTSEDSPSTASPTNSSNHASLPSSGTLTGGTHGRLILLSRLSASRNRAGDVFQARLVEPVRLSSTVVLPEGALYEGRVVKSVPPRRLSRPGSLHLTFTRLTLPTGERAAMVASLAGAELDQRSQIRMNSEGVLSGGSPGKGRLLIDVGVAGGIAKVSDDCMQLIVEAIISTATDASTAGSARVVATALSGLYLITRHGRDVILPKYTKLDVAFDQPLSLSPSGR